MIATPKNLIACNAKLNVSYDKPKSLGDLFRASDRRQIVKEIQSGKLGEARFLRMLGGEFVWTSMFEADQYVGIDLTYIDEEKTPDDNANYLFAKCVQELTNAHDKATASSKCDGIKYFDTLVRGVHNLTRFHRTMIYRFDPDWNGEVIAEARSN